MVHVYILQLASSVPSLQSCSLSHLQLFKIQASTSHWNSSAVQFRAGSINTHTIYRYNKAMVSLKEKEYGRFTSTSTSLGNGWV